MNLSLYTFITGVLNVVEGAAQAVFPLPALRKEELSGLVPKIVEDCGNIFHNALQETATSLNFLAPSKQDPHFLHKMSEIKAVVIKALAEPQLLTKGMRDFWLNYDIFGLKGQISHIGVQVRFRMKAEMANETFIIQVKPVKTTLIIDQDT